MPSTSAAGRSGPKEQARRDDRALGVRDRCLRHAIRARRRLSLSRTWRGLPGLSGRRRRFHTRARRRDGRDPHGRLLDARLWSRRWRPRRPGLQLHLHSERPRSFSERARFSRISFFGTCSTHPQTARARPAKPTIYFRQHGSIRGVSGTVVLSTRSLIWRTSGGTRTARSAVRVQRSTFRGCAKSSLSKTTGGAVCALSTPFRWGGRRWSTMEFLRERRRRMADMIRVAFRQLGGSQMPRHSRRRGFCRVRRQCGNALWRSSARCVLFGRSTRHTSAARLRGIETAS